MSYLNILLVAKVLRRLAKNKSTAKLFEVKGLFVDKMCGIIQCRLSVDMRVQSDMRVYNQTDFVDYTTVILTPASLLTHFQLFCGY